VDEEQLQQAVKEQKQTNWFRTCLWCAQ